MHLFEDKCYSSNINNTCIKSSSLWCVTNPACNAAPFGPLTRALPSPGFLPTFGPAWVNVYGARREWELLEGDKSESMNVGVEEGCAYRGRVLMALHTHVGSYPPAPSTAIDNDAFNAVRVSAGPWTKREGPEDLDWKDNRI